jgi:cell division protein ZapA
MSQVQPQARIQERDQEPNKEPQMAQVTATIAGRNFRLACEDGQEEHLLALAADVDARIAELRQRFGEIGDTRLTVMAALMVADEVSEANARIRRMEEEIAALQDARVVSADRAKAASAAVVGAFNSAAERIEGLTRKLNQTVGESIAIG